MKKRKILLTLLTAGILMLSGCGSSNKGENRTINNKTEETTETETEEIAEADTEEYIDDEDGMYLVKSIHNVSPYNDTVYTYTYDFNLGTVTTDGLYCVENLRHPELQLVIQNYNLDSMYFFSPNDICPLINSYIDEKHTYDFSYDDDGNVSYRHYTNEPDNYEEEFYYQYEDDGRCYSCGETGYKYDFEYDNKGYVSRCHTYSDYDNTGYTDIYYSYDENGRFINVYGSAWSYDISLSFNYDDLNNIGYIIDNINNSTEILYFDDNGLCYKKTNEAGNDITTYDYIKVSDEGNIISEVLAEDSEIEFGNSSEVVIPDVQEPEVSYTDANNCPMDSSVVSIEFYDNFNSEYEFVRPTVVQIADMIFYKDMKISEFINTVEQSKFQCDGYNVNLDEIMSPDNKIFTMTISVNGENAFEVKLVNSADEPVRLGDCTIFDINMISGTSCCWYNAYGFGSYGKNIPEYFTFRDLLDLNEVGYFDSSSDGSLIVRVERGRYSAEGSHEASFYFDNLSGECIKTSWDDGDGFFK
ncbi:MAG: hypothetical protein IJ763_09660 [Lachnospiraceae bacterium]|nr:hypothetical protein [Lachnospiraceae bacterium]